MSKSAKSEQATNRVQFVEVDENQAGQRVDNFLIARLKGVPKTMIYRIIRKGEVRVNKGRVKQTSRLNAGDIVRIPPIKTADRGSITVDRNKYTYLNQRVLFEDDAVLVLDKPSGLAVHAGSGISVGVIEALRALRSDLKYLELAHRLDRETSGCLVLAKKAACLRVLSEDFRTHSQKNSRLDKRYLAMVKGRWRHGERKVVKPLDTSARRGGERHVVVSESGSYAQSTFSPVSAKDQVSLVEVAIVTGRTHQVRVHAQSEGHPIAGDARYGDSEFNRAMKSLGLKRLFLHASSLRFLHPVTRQAISVTAPLPKDLQAIFDQVG